MSNTLVIGTPSQTNMPNKTCNSTCSDLGPFDPWNKSELGPRKKREQVREQLKDYVLHKLGAPVVKIELDEQNLDRCVDYALRVFEEYAPREFFSLYTFNSQAGKSVYELPPDVGVVRQVYYKQAPTFAFQSTDLDGAIPIEYFYPGGTYSSIQGGLIDPIQPIWGRMGEWVLYKQYEQMYSNISSNIGGWEFVGDMGMIKLYPTPVAPQRVIVQYLQKMKDWKEVTLSMMDIALAEAKEVLGRIRSKYTQMPGAAAGQLDGSTLLQEAAAEKTLWKEEIISRYGDVLPITFG